jgi:hypothetical protein
LRKVLQILSVFVLPILYALSLRVIFGLDTQNDLFEIMTLGYLAFSPAGMGAIAVYLSDVENDEHVVIGGDYFDVMDGTYELEQLDAATHRLHLRSRFQLTTTFNFYASVWARWIMQDIQNNILQVEKIRAESH